MTEIKNTSVIEFSDISDDEMNKMIDGTINEFDDGDLVDGTIVKIESDEVLVDIGFKSEGVIPVRELSIRKDADPSDLVNVGDRIEALVLQKEDKDGRLILSKRRAEYERAWISVEEKFKAGELVSGEVIEVVKGGLILDIGLRGFLPASLVDLRRVKDLEMYLNTEIEARVIEMDRNRNNVVLSRRVLLEEGRKNERAEIISKISKGMRLKGTVSSIVDFGAFVDLGGIDGLVHISELSWNHVNHPSEVVKVGDEVEVVVLDVDTQRERISLGLKQTTEDPWIKLVSAYPVGSIVDGKVTKIVPFGVFVELGDPVEGHSVEGLVHISEMAMRHIDTPAQVVKVGDEIKVKVMEINAERRRVSLSMKAAAEELGFEIVVDESIQPEERPIKRTKKGERSSNTAEEATDETIERAEDALDAADATEEAAEDARDAADATEEAAEDARDAAEEAVDEAEAEADEVKTEAEEVIADEAEKVAQESEGSDSVNETVEQAEDALDAADATEEAAEDARDAAEEAVDEAEAEADEVKTEAEEIIADEAETQAADIEEKADVEQATE